MNRLMPNGRWYANSVSNSSIASIQQNNIGYKLLAPSHYSTGNGQQCLWDSCGFTKHPSTCISYSFHTGWIVELSDSTECYLVTWITLSKSHLQLIDSEFKFYARKVAFPLHNRGLPPSPNKSLSLSVPLRISPIQLTILFEALICSFFILLDSSARAVFIGIV